jgi:hypothetical protein
MGARLTRTLVVTAVLLAACGPGEQAAPRSSTAPPPTTTAPEAVPVAFAYAYEPGDHHDYAFTLDQDLAMTVAAEGAESLLGADLPEDINVTTSIAGTVSYDIAAGPEPGTRQISISGVFDEFGIEGTVDGEPVEEEMVAEGQVPDLVEVPNVTIVIDERGRLVSVDGQDIPENMPFFGDPFSRLSDFTSGGLSGHFGPAFPDEPLADGATWSVSQSEELEGLDATVEIDTTYTYAGTETLGEHKVAVVRFTTETSEVVLDLGEMFQALFDAFGELGAETGDESTSTRPEIPDITFSITVAPSTAEGTVWFDRDEGIVVKSSQDTTATISMLMDISDAAETVRTAVTMRLGMQLDAELIEHPST